MNQPDADAVVMAILRFLSARQVSVVDGLAVLSVTAASCMLGRPPDQQDALLRGFKRAVSQNLASMQARLDRDTAGGQQ